MLLLLCVASVVSDSMRPHRRQPTRLPRPWDSPGKNTGVSCHFPLQCMKVKSESEVDQSCPTLCDPLDCSPPGSSIHGIFQARVLEWGAIAFSDSNMLLQSKVNIFRKTPLFQKHCCCQSINHIRLFETTQTVVCQAPLSSTISQSCSNSCPLSQWCYLTISSSATSLSFCFQSFPTSGSFPMSWLFTSGGQKSTGSSASATVLLTNIQSCLSNEYSSCPAIILWKYWFLFFFFFGEQGPHFIFQSRFYTLSCA